MTAIAALIDVTAEDSGAAALDRDHGAPPRGGQRRDVPITKRRAEAAEHVRHFQLTASHGNRLSGGHEVRHAWHWDVERFQRTDRGADLAGGDHEIPGRGTQITMTEQQLNGA